MGVQSEEEGESRGLTNGYSTVAFDDVPSFYLEQIPYNVDRLLEVLR